MSSEIPKHHLGSHFASAGDELVMGGVPLSRLAERAGGTPFYAYERESLTRRVRELREALPPEIRLHYAMKANPMPAVVQHMAALVDGIDVASAGEMRIALDTPMNPQHISIAGPGKRRPEVAAAIAAGIVINVESFRELEAAAEESARLGLPARVALRINPVFELKASGMKMSGGAKPFGVDEEQLPALLKRTGELDVDFVGFHIFSGSQNLNPAVLIEAQKKSVDLALQLAGHCPRPVRKLNIGGGFGIPYFPGDRPLDLAPIGAALYERLDEVKRSLPDAALILELGRYLVGEAGIYVCRVIDRKISRGQIFLVVDGGLHHHLAASGNFGQVIRKNYPVVIGNKVQGQVREIASVVGPLCTPLDLLADKMDLAAAEVGDLVVVFQSGAYGLTASPVGFLSHPAPREMLV